MSRTTYGQLKKRILSCLFENEFGEAEVVYLNDARGAVSKRIPDTVNACLVRMFESLPLGRKKMCLTLSEPDERGYRRASLPVDFLRFDDGALNYCSDTDVYTNDGYVYFSDSFLCGRVNADFYYRILVPEVSEETEDEFEFDMVSLAFEALICLCAAELCRESSPSLYSRLYYKYNDLCEGLYKPSPSSRKNSFFSSSRKRGWRS